MAEETLRKDLAPTIQKYRKLRPLYKRRGYLFIPPMLVMIFCSWNEYENDLIIWPLGLSIMALGFIVRIWATKHIGRRIPRKYKNGRRRHLMVTGPYSIVRNPLYIGNIVAMLGLCVLSELLWFIPLVLAYFYLLYSLVVRYEEYKLAVLFGREYESYCQKVARWIPRFPMTLWANGEYFTWLRSIQGELRSLAHIFPMILVLVGKEII